MSTAKPVAVPTAKTLAPAKPAGNRIASLDQFRGYTVAGMFLVNFVGAYAVTPIVLTHKNTFCSYADTIMPQFFFAVGFAYRLTFGRRTQTEGLASAYWHMVRRMLGLALIAIVIYNVGDGRQFMEAFREKGLWEALWPRIRGSWFQTLMHIAVTSLWILPVIRASAMVRILWMIFSAGLHVFLSWLFYFEWVHHGGTDGGILGFLAWTIPTIVGTLACDAVVTPDGRPRLVKMIFWSIVLMGLGYLASCGTTLYDVPEEQVALLKEHPRADDPVVPSPERLEAHQIRWAEPPFVPPPAAREHNYWMMSQKAATLSYHLFAAGFSLAVYVLFYIVCDIWGFTLGLFRTLGTNALVGYILHGMVGNAIEPFLSRDSPAWWVTLAFLIYFGITYLFIRHLEKNNIYLKL